MDAKTALYDEHVALGGKMISFGGWLMPVQYSGLADEHLNCRKNAALFDVSHMGEFHIRGKDAETFVNFLVSNDIRLAAPGQAQYAVFCQENGGIVDDLLVYRRQVLGTEMFLLVVNAANIDKDFKHVQAVKHKYFAKSDVILENRSADYSQIAIQGPKAQEILQKLTDDSLDEIKTYHFIESTLLNEIPGIISRTGYTGEDGFEIYLPHSQAAMLWRKLLEVGKPLGLKPAGLGARDTLRLEVKYPLYGNELSLDIHPLEADLGWVTKLSKEKFLGQAALVKIKSAGLRRKLVGIQIDAKKSRAIARAGYKIFAAEGPQEIGAITSGTQSPSLGHAIALGYVELSHAKIGTEVLIEIRTEKHAAHIVATPFLKKELTSLGEKK